MGKWDSTSKRLLREKPQHYTSWLIDGALFIKALPTELKSRNIYTDGLFEILIREKQALLHIEFQRYKDPLMLERLLEYNVLAASENDWMPVYTFVIYLRKDGEVPTSPFVRRLPTGQEYHRFHFGGIELGKMSPQQLLAAGLSGLLPLIPLTEGGAEPEYMEQMITPLVEAGEFELLALGYAFAGLASNDPAYDEWLHRRFALLEDILEESWTYQEIMKKGMRQERLQRVQEQREMLVNLVRMRFPDLVTLTEVRTRDLNDPDVLHNLISRLFAVQTAEEAKQVLMEVKPEEE